MAVDPKAVKTTVSFKGGTLTATLGLIEYVFGAQKTTWQPIADAPTVPGGRRRRKYGTRQRSQAEGGRVLYFKLDTGGLWTVRTTGADIDLIDELLVKADTAKLKNVYTARGTKFGPQYAELK